jgi:hypothetical protein
MSRDMAHERRVAAERRERAMRAKRESALELDTETSYVGSILFCLVFVFVFVFWFFFRNPELTADPPPSLHIMPYIVA